MKRGIRVVGGDRLEVITRLYAPILNFIPSSQLVSLDERLGQGIVQVPWTYENATRLIRLGAPAISPMVRDYDYPSKHPKEFSWQLQIADFLALNRRAFCFADMGLGKTLSTIWAADYLMRIGEVKRALVIAPLTILEPAWADELFGAIPSVPHRVLYASNRDRRVMLAAGEEPWHIVNYDGVKTILNELMFNAYDLIILDESTQIKNERTDRWKAVNRLIRPHTRVWALSGAPTPQGPMDAYGQAKMLRPDLMDMPRYAFQNRVETKVGGFKWVPRRGHQEVVQSVLSPAVYFKKEDHLTELPPVTKIFRKVEFTPTQNRLIKELKADSKTQAAEFSITAGHAGIVRNKFCQIASGAVYADDGTALKVDNRPRIRACIELIEQARENRIEGTPSGKFIIMAPFLHAVDALMEELSKTYDVRAITSEVKQKERSEIIRIFQTTEEIDGIIAIPSTMSHGITATAANLTIWFTPIDSNETYTQACNRMDRPGQKQNMVIAHLYGDNQEKSLYDNLGRLGNTQEALLAWYDAFIRGI